MAVFTLMKKWTRCLIKLFWADIAKRDLVSIFIYIVADNPAAAKRMVNRR